MNLLLRLGLASTLALAACHTQVSGNGVLGVEPRTVAPFDEVEISLGIEATVTAAAPLQTLSLSGDSNLLQYILTPVEAGVLGTQLDRIGSIVPINPLRLFAAVTSLRRVKATEASKIEVTQAGSAAGGSTFVVEAAGASYVQLAGPGGDRLEVNLSGGSGLDAWSYPVAGANVLVGGGSQLRVNSVGDVAGSAADQSSVLITGGGTCAALVLSGGATCQFR